MAEEGKEKIEKFNGMNFQWLKMQVEDYYPKDLYLLLVGKKLKAMNANEWAILDRQKLVIGRLSMTPQVAFNISKEKTIVVMMEVLEKLYEKPFASNKVLLVKRLLNMRMSENGSVVDHLDDFNGRQNNKQNNGGRNPTRGRSKSRGKSKSKGRIIVCWNCNKEDHKKDDFMEPKKKRGVGKDKVMMKGQTWNNNRVRILARLGKISMSWESTNLRNKGVVGGDADSGVHRTITVMTCEDAKRRMWLVCAKVGEEG
ncbi:hypothetical protein RJ639_012861 [Escallonia herrerae]|uniref:Retrovirus-related Pol polyprotein from transposon TNT 1-94 n=1 Tax=Escallonia herrerae TaxID=1293975 RepID=A0AA88VLD9_9ASTE|nr:hypothetical protein RJ639_012861 [Escallonia herrerae]